MRHAREWQAPDSLPLLAAPFLAPCAPQPTGVPLVDELMKLSSVDAAWHHSVRLLAFLAALAVAGNLLLRAVDRLAGERLSASTERFSLAAAVVAAALRPCQVRSRCDEFESHSFIHVLPAMLCPLPAMLSSAAASA